MTAKKGQSFLISHAILVSISIVLVFIVIYTFTNIRTDYQNFIGGVALEQACSEIKGSIEKVYNPPIYQSPSDTVYGQMRISLPEKAAGIKYRTTFENLSLKLETIGEPRINTSCRIGIDAQYIGSTTGGATDITYIETSNGTNKILMEQVG